MSCDVPGSHPVVVVDGCQWDLSNLTGIHDESHYNDSFGISSRGAEEPSPPVPEEPAVEPWLAYYPKTRDIPACLDVDDIFDKLKASNMLKRGGGGRLANPQLANLSPAELDQKIPPSPKRLPHVGRTRSINLEPRRLGSSSNHSSNSHSSNHRRREYDYDDYGRRYDSYEHRREEDAYSRRIDHDDRRSRGRYRQEDDYSPSRTRYNDDYPSRRDYDDDRAARDRDRRYRDYDDYGDRRRDEYRRREDYDYNDRRNRPHPEDSRSRRVDDHDREQQQRQYDREQQQRQYDREQQQRQCDREQDYDQTLVEVTPGNYVPLRGSQETWNAVQLDRVVKTTCFSCMASLVCVNDADMVMCPGCRVISPVDTGVGGGGLGLGMKEEDATNELNRLRQEQARSRNHSNYR